MDNYQCKFTLMMNHRYLHDGKKLHIVFLKIQLIFTEIQIEPFFCTDHVKFYNANLLELYEFLSLKNQ